MTGKLENLTMNKLLEIIRDEEASTPKARTIAIGEIQRRIKQITERLAAYEADERGHYPTATIFENAPLALVQLGLETGKRELKWILKLIDGNGDEQ